MKPGNIWSGNPNLAWLTAPTALAFRKGHCSHNFGMAYNKRMWPDAEAAYQALARETKHISLADRADLMTHILFHRFLHYLETWRKLNALGGVQFLAQCEHFASRRKSPWQGKGFNSLYLRCLRDAYLRAQPKIPPTT